MPCSLLVTAARGNLVAVQLHDPTARVLDITCCTNVVCNHKFITATLAGSHEHALAPPAKRGRRAVATRYDDVHAAAHFTALRAGDGLIYVCGLNSYGQLGCLV